jgi:ATP-dependent 26S proteasome regulatory subunit
VSPSLPPIDELLPALHLLDGLLDRTLKLAETLQGTGAEQELNIPPLYPRYRPAQSTELPSSQIQPTSRLGRLQQHFNLSLFDLDIFFIALAPELDRRYEKIYAYLQQDGRSIRPSVSLILDLLCTDAAEKLQRRSHFSPDAPLLQPELLQFSSPPKSLLAQEISLDLAIVRYLLDETGLDADLSSGCTLTPSTALQTASLPPALTQQLAGIVQGRVSTPIRLYLQGSDAVTSRQFATHLAHQFKFPLLTVDLDILLQQPEQWRQRLRRIGRDAWLQNTLLYLHPVDRLYQDATHLQSSLLDLLAETPTPIVMAGTQPWQPAPTHSLGIVTLALVAPSFSDHRTNWTIHLTQAGIRVEPSMIHTLSDRFRLTATQIQDAIATVQNQLAYALELPDLKATLFQAARQQSGHRLAQLAQAIQPRYDWSDLVLPNVQLEQLQEICLHLKHRYTVFETWGFDRKLSLGKGVNALFAGASGTGKTMAAEVIASSLQLDLYRIDLSQVVSKYIGETEKNLSQIFTAAANANAILLFDEADALFGKRTEISDSHDRYANIEVGYLLQQMEAYEGLAILTTNLKSNLDEAFIRRLRFIVDFSLPSGAERYQIWQQIFPKMLPIDPEIDWHMLAKQFEITGGNIRNIALAAAFLAADDGKNLTMLHLKQAIRREYQKMGKPLMESELESL